MNFRPAAFAHSLTAVTPALALANFPALKDEPEGLRESLGHTGSDSETCQRIGAEVLGGGVEPGYSG